MNEIVCPHCQKAFKIDESGYADILQQVWSHEFEEELIKRENYLREGKRIYIRNSLDFIFQISHKAFP